MRNAKFEKEIAQNIVDASGYQTILPTYGIVMNYNSIHNTADIIISDQGSDNFGEVFRNVPCPMIPGVQSTAPQKGTPCFVIFKDNRGSYPVVTHFFNHVYGQFSYGPQYQAINPLPRFMLDL